MQAICFVLALHFTGFEPIKDTGMKAGECVFWVPDSLSYI